MKGFTLLEVLVVVLIVGILSAVAMPQYEKAVEKSRATEAMINGKAIVEAQNRSLTAFPNDPVNEKTALDIKLSGGNWSGNVFSTAKFTYTLQANGVEIKRSNNDYTLFMGNRNATEDNYCTGSICSVFKGHGFVPKTDSK